MGLFKAHKTQSKFKFLRTTRTEVENFSEKVQKFTRETGREFVDKNPKFHEGLINDLADLFLNDEKVVFTTPEVHRDVLNAFATGFISDIHSTNLKQVAQKDFLKEFAQSDFFKTLKTSMTLEEAVHQILEIFQESSNKNGQQKNNQQSPSNSQGGSGNSQNDDQNYSQNDGGSRPNNGQGKNQNIEGNASPKEMQEIMDNAKNIVDAMSNPIGLELLQSMAGVQAEEREGNQDFLASKIAGKGTADPVSMKKFVKDIIHYHKLIHQSQHKSAMFDMARKLTLAAKRHKGWKFEPDLVAEEQRILRMERYSQASKVIPTQMAYEDDLFYHKFAKKELLVNERVTRKDKTQILHILLDVSSSMGDVLEMGSLPSCVYASAITLSFLRNTIDNGDKFLFRFFESVPFPLHIVDNKESALKLTKEITTNPFNGGGTNIQRAIDAAIKDIIEYRRKNRESDFGKAEILVITDGGDHVSHESLKKTLEREDIKLHAIVISEIKNESLAKVCEKKFLVSPSKLKDNAARIVQEIVAENDKDHEMAKNKLTY
jgi:uncharacterized protein with von Willebrand factor type A (vWA) domain